MDSFKDLLVTQRENFANIVFARSNPNTIYAAGNEHIYKSKDNGKNWKELKQIPEELGFKDEYIATPSSFLSVDPNDENKIWVVQSRSSGAVFFSEDGGETWKNPLDSNMKNEEFRWVILTGDELNGVYLATDKASKIYYKDDSMQNWMDYSSGFPPAARLTRLVPFFKEGKLRAATSQGIWEAPLYNQKFKPIAQPIALDLSGPNLKNANTPIQFDSYSIVNQNGATWEWSFSPEPKFVSNKKVRNPRVQFGFNGEYDVTLKVTTADGKSHSRTIPKMIIVTNGEKRPNTPLPPSEPEKRICFKPAKMGGVVLPTKIIISSTNKDGNNLKQYNNGFIKMESTDSPFVITRLTNKERNSIKKPLEGMLIWNIDNQCLELYRDSKWECITQGCDE